MHRVLLVGMEGDELRTASPRPPALAGLQLEASSTEQLLERLRTAESVDAVLVGGEVPDPIGVAQRAHSVDRDLSIVILCAPERSEQVLQALRFAPMLQGDVRCLSAPDPWTLVEDLTEAASLTSRRREHRRTLEAVNQQVARVRPVRTVEVDSLGQLLDVAPVGVSGVDETGRVVAWNRRAEQIFKRPAAQMMGKPFSDLLPPAERSRWEEVLGRATSLQAPLLMQVERTRDGGQLQYVEITAAPLVTGGGAAGLMLLFQDVTERRMIEAERGELLKQTQLALAVRDEFLSVASHELRTPLTSLRLVLQSVIRDRGDWHLPDDKDEALVRRITTAERQVIRLTRLVEGLLDVSSVQSGRLRLERSVVNLEELAVRVVNDLQDQFERAGCEAHLATAPVKGAWDERRLEQVISHLVANALRYAPGTRVELRVGIASNEAVFEVQDHGIGIDPGQVDRIFDRFERAAPSRNFGGLGLGLYISKKIVEAHGGAITVRSAPGKGATFRVTLPLSSN